MPIIEAHQLLQSVFPKPVVFILPYDLFFLL